MHEARLDHAGVRVEWNVTGVRGTSLLNSRDKLLRRASIPQSTEILAQIKAERIRLAEWRDQLEGKLQLAKQTLTRVRDEHHRALTQWQLWVS